MEASPLFFKNRKKCHGFWKKSPDNVQLWVKFSIQNVVLRISTKKTPKCFPAGPLFLVFLTKFLSNCLILTNFCLCTRTQVLFFLAKHSILNVWQSSEYVCLDNCSVIVQRSYAIYCIRHIKNSGIFNTLLFQVYARIFNRIQRYWDIFTHTETLLRHT